MPTQYRIPVEETFSWQRPVIDKDLNTPPGTPVKGDRYIVGPSPTGAWATYAGKIAWCSNATGPVWTFDTPLEGWTVFIKDEDLNYYHSGSAWVAIPASHTQGTDTTLGTMAGNIAMNSNKVTGLGVPSTSGDAIRQTATVTESALGTAISNSHAAGADTTLGTMSADIAMGGTMQITGLALPAASGEAIRQTATVTETSLIAAVAATATWDVGLGCILMTL